jgi:hypothetical protein
MSFMAKFSWVGQDWRFGRTTIFYVIPGREPTGAAGACDRAGQRPDPVGRPRNKLPGIVGASQNSIGFAATPVLRPAKSESAMTSQKGPNIKKKQKCKNCEGKGLLKKGDKVVRCQRCKGTGFR